MEIIQKENFTSHNNENPNNTSYSLTNILLIMVVLSMIYLYFTKESYKPEVKTLPVTSNVNNIVFLLLLAGLYYFYNYKYKNKTDYDDTGIIKRKKMKKEKEVLPRFSNLPEINSKDLTNKLGGDSVEDYLEYFKQFNKPLVKDITADLRRFSSKKDGILSQKINFFLVQELDNLNFLKDNIIDKTNSLIYSIDISNRETELIYDKFNSMLNDLLEREYNYTKDESKKKKSNNIKNCEADIDIFSGVILSDENVLPSNY